MGKIILKAKTYSFDQVKSGLRENLDPYENSSLAFCRDWLIGKPAFTLITSGSTGVPKRISIDRLQMVSSAAATKKFFEIVGPSRLLGCLDTHMVAGKMMLVRAMEWDSEIVLIPPQKKPLEAEWFDPKFDFAAMVPMQVAACLEDPTTLKHLKKIKHLIIGGAPTPPGIIAKILKEKLQVFQSYGMTETVSHIALAKIKHGNLIYKKLPSVTIGTDEDQRLWIEGPMAGKGRIQTEDIVDLIAEDTFIWLGRSDFTINSGGIKIQPEQIEKTIFETIMSQFGNSRFLIAGLPDAVYGQKVTLLLENTEISDKEAKLLLKELQKILPKYHVPKEVIRLEKFIETQSGKVDRPATIRTL